MNNTNPVIKSRPYISNRGGPDSHRKEKSRRINWRSPSLCGPEVFASRSRNLTRGKFKSRFMVYELLKPVTVWGGPQVWSRAYAAGSLGGSSGRDGRGKNAAVILGVDYKKAFSRMEHRACLERPRQLGASEGSLSMVRAFLEDRVMQISIDGHQAEAVPIQRGSPQGSVLGCLLYCATTQNLTKGLRGVVGTAGTRKPAVFMYVDDTTLVDIVPTSDAAVHITTAMTTAHMERLDLEGDMDNLNQRAEDIGMRINAKKTQPLVVATPNGYNTTAGLDANGEKILSVDKLKLVGFTFGSRPDVGEHVRAVQDKIRRKIWMMYKLRRAGFRGGNLYRLYCYFLRSIVEYCSVVYHSLLTRGQAWDLERIQRLAVRICYGNGDTDAIMTEHGIQPLEERRRRRCDAFLSKAVRHPVFGRRWFPPRVGERRDLRRREIKETRAAANRRFKLPLAFLRRRANELNLQPPEAGAT